MNASRYSILVAICYIRPIRLACDAQILTSDSKQYDEEMYLQLVDEYGRDLLKDKEGETMFPNRANFHFTSNDNEMSGKLIENTSKLGKVLNFEDFQTHETYEQMALRLNCEHPWFWNSIKFVLLYS